MKKTVHKIIIGDSRNLKLIKDESIHLIITSSPYGDKKDYEHKNQIGYNQTFEEYIDSLCKVLDECYRVLCKGRRLCFNIGDKYNSAKEYGRYYIDSIKSYIIIHCLEIGFDFMGNIIWEKISTSNPSGGGFHMGSWLYPTDPIIKYNFEYILLFKKPLERESDKIEISEEQKQLSKMTEEEYIEYTKPIWRGIKGVPQNKGHPAEFPLEIPHRLIRLFSFVNETVLDVFLGSGTTTLACLKNKRNSIGYEINPKFISRIKKKVGINKLTEIINKDYFQIIRQE